MPTSGMRHLLTPQRPGPADVGSLPERMGLVREPRYDLRREVAPAFARLAALAFVAWQLLDRAFA